MVECKYIHGDGHYSVEDTDTQSPKLLPPHPKKIICSYIVCAWGKSPEIRASGYILYSIVCT